MRSSGRLLVLAALAVALAGAARPAAQAPGTLPPGAPAPGVAPPEAARLTAVRREVLAHALRVTLELDRQTSFRHEWLTGPDRVYLDLDATTVAGDLARRDVSFRDDVVRRVRFGAQEGGRTRVVLDLDGATRHTVYVLDDPFRIIIDVERATEAAASVRPRPSPFPLPREALPASPVPPEAVLVAASPAAVAAPAGDLAVVPAPAPEPPLEPGAIPDANLEGGFSLSRQLGLGIGRIVIDPGHGGRDPGSLGRGIVEAELVLDVALRLERLLAAQPGVEVVLTRKADVFVPLEERTAIANRAGADLFLSIHANASANREARGVETFFLNFARDAAAESLAARENAGSSQTMRSLPDIVQAIALNNKLDESRDFATMVHQAVHTRLSAVDRRVEDRGVKQAPFVVLIGATMPSVLAEISFLTNEEEANLLRTDAYRQRIAEALLEGIQRYQTSLHHTGVTAGVRALD